MMRSEVRQMNSTTKLQIAAIEKQPETLVMIHVGAQEPKSLSFEPLFMETLDEVFGSLGEKCRTAIYHSIEKQYGMNKAEIAAHTKGLEQAMEELFGEAASILMISIIRNLHKKVHDFSFAEEVFSFSNYMEHLRSFLSA